MRIYFKVELFFLVYFSLIASCSTSQTKYENMYTISQESHSGYYCFSVDNKEQINPDSCKIEIEVFQSVNSEVYFLPVRMQVYINNNEDTLNLLVSDENSSITIPKDHFSFKVLETPSIKGYINNYNKENYINLKIFLGKSGLEILILKSIRPLSANEINVTVKQILRGNTNESKLINDGTCIWSWQGG